MKIVIGLERMIENMPYVKNKNGFEIEIGQLQREKLIVVQVILKIYILFN